MPTTLTDASMYYYSQLVFLPIILIISFALFQYLSFMYYNRRKEPRGMLLLGSAFLGFAVLVPLAHPSEELVHHLNDISEACSTLTFLIQITIIGRESNRKVKIKSVYYMTLLAELLVVVEIGIILLDLVEVGRPSFGSSVSKGINQIVEDVTLVFIFVFRFYYLALIKGFATIVKTRKKEIAVYLLFLTHEYLFLALEASTDVTWEYVQGVYHRLLVAACVWLTVVDKLKHGGGLGVLTSTKLSQHVSQHLSHSSQGRRKVPSELSAGPDAKAATKRGPSMLQATTASVAPAMPRESTAQIRR